MKPEIIENAKVRYYPDTKLLRVDYGRIEGMDSTTHYRLFNVKD